MKYLSYLILIATIIFNLWLNYPETQILADPNDNIFQYSLVYRTNWVWENYGCPLSLSCIPNLFDHVVPTWAEGYPLPYYYTHIPQIVTVASYKLFINPIASIFNFQFSIFNFYNLTKYLLLCFFPLSVFFALRLVGFSAIVSSISSFFAANFSTDGLYGIDPPSFLWRGWGLTSQLYAVFWLPLGLAFTYRALKHLGSNRRKSQHGGESHDSPKLKRWERKRVLRFSSNQVFFAVVFLTLTTMGHLGIGIIGFLSTSVFILLDVNKKNIWLRFKKLLLILISCFLILSYWLIPILLTNKYHIISFWDPIWKFDSYGWYEVVRQLFQGEIFDWKRPPIVTSLTLIGFFTLIIGSFPPNPKGDDKEKITQFKKIKDDKRFIFSILFAFWFLAYFGRTTWNGLIDLVPAMKEFHLHRFIVGVHVAALFLIAGGVEYLFHFIKKIISFLEAIYSKLDIKSQLKLQRSNIDPLYKSIIFYITSILLFSTLVFYTLGQTLDYAHFNNKWIGEANKAYKYDEANFKNLVSFLKGKPQGRIYAGRPGNWGKDFRLGSTEMYMLLGVHGFDMSQFLPETWSPLSENEQNFDERVYQDYNLLNIRYVVADSNHDFTDKAQQARKFGPFEVYEVPTSGFFDVVSSPMLVKTKKTDYINIVHYWHRGYPRRWKMHPLISVEKKPSMPEGVQKIIRMTDEVSYVEKIVSDKDTSGVTRRGSPDGGETEEKNIFSDFPFVFPEATPSAKIIKEEINRQSYKGTVTVPQNCQNCFVMFKMSYHPNWKVKVDEKEAEKYAVFPFYLATPVTSGTHSVEFSYQPNRLKAVLLFGEILFLAGIFMLKKRSLS